jgi:hypothetical protein
MPDGPTAPAARCGPCRRAHGRTHVPRARRRVARGRGPRRLYRAGTSRHGGRRLANPGRGRDPGAGTRPARAARPTIASGAAGRFALAGAKRERRLPARYGPAPEVPAAPAPPPSGSSVLTSAPASRPPAAPTGACVRGAAPARECPPASESAPPSRTSRPMCLRGGRKRRHSVGRVPATRTGGMYPWPRPATGRSPGEARERYERHVSRRRHLRRSDPA